MTGFGRGEAQVDGYQFLAEIKSVNHRFLNTKLRLPREFSHLENTLVALCAERCERGHLAVKVEIEPTVGGASQVPRLNQPLVDEFLEIARKLGSRVEGGFNIHTLLSLPGVIEWHSAGEGLGDDAFLTGAREALGAALDQLVASRRTEGEALERDFRSRLEMIERWRQVLEERAPEREQRERHRLREKVQALVPELAEELDHRVTQEIVLIADRLDISEELMRMRTHIEQFGAELSAANGGAVGRKLTFLIQEMNREANTVAAKANDAEMQQAAIEIKTEMEKLREQAENVE
jgi:uncharacterized protein (TIGR00255 family)